MCDTVAGISVLSVIAVDGKGGGRAGTRSLEWLVAAGSGPVISKQSATNKPNGLLRPPSTEVGGLVVVKALQLVSQRESNFTCYATLVCRLHCIFSVRD